MSSLFSLTPYVVNSVRNSALLTLQPGLHLQTTCTCFLKKKVNKSKRKDLYFFFFQFSGLLKDFNEAEYLTNLERENVLSRTVGGIRKIEKLKMTLIVWL